jgi:O-antigen/teichoic acid export membrane protein
VAGGPTQGRPFEATSGVALAMTEAGLGAGPQSPQGGAPSSKVLANEVAIAIRNGIKLGGSLLITWSVALIIKFQIPQHLGPVRQGYFGFAESFATIFFSVLGLGVDTYVAREVPVRIEHASDFIGGVFALRSMLSTVIFAIMATTLWATGRSGEIQLAAAVFGVTQVLICFNATLAAVLQATTHVGRLAVANVVAKILWGIGLLVGLHYSVPLYMLALPMAVSELLRTAVLVPASRVAANLRFRIDAAISRDVIRTSIPFFVNSLAVTFGNNLALSALEFIRRDEREVGWFAAAQNLGSLAMLMYPLLAWIVMPMLSRAKARSEAEMMLILQRAIEGLLVTILPLTTLISVGAGIFVKVAFGAKFLPAETGLSILSLVFLLTYLNIMFATALFITNKSWSVTTISVASIFVLALFMLIFVPIGRMVFGTGGECAGAAIATILSELCVVIAMLFRIGLEPMDRRNVEVLVKSLGISFVVIVIDRFLRVLPLGVVRLAIDMTIYGSLALVLGVVRLTDVRRVVKVVRSRRAESRSG